MARDEYYGLESKRSNDALRLKRGCSVAYGTEAILAWQRKFNAVAVVWAVLDEEGSVSNLYDSEEAAQFEVKARPKRSLVKIHVHNVALAAERWKAA